MASWIQSVTTLSNHPKLFRLMESLSITAREAVGVLHLLWHWCAEYADTGDLTAVSPALIARACDWPGDPKVLLDGLVVSGFLDRAGRRLSVHEWSDYRLYAHASEERRDRERDQVRLRVQEYRKRKGIGNGVSNGAVTRCNAAKEGKEGNEGKEGPDAGVTHGFDLFWKAYPNKKAKREAEKAWKKLAPDAALLASILAAIEVGKSTPTWQKDAGQYIPLPPTWINGRRWEDEVTSVAPVVDQEAVNEQVRRQNELDASDPWRHADAEMTAGRKAI
jgi:hypothetical protein